jgi:hypothetical protein
MDIAVSLGTDKTLIPIGFRISLDLPDPVVLYMSEDGAAIATAIAKSWNPGDRRLRAEPGPTLKIQELNAQAQSPRLTAVPFKNFRRVIMEQLSLCRILAS